MNRGKRAAWPTLAFMLGASLWGVVWYPPADARGARRDRQGRERGGNCRNDCGDDCGDDCSNDCGEPDCGPRSARNGALAMV